MEKNNITPDFNSIADLIAAFGGVRPFSTRLDCPSPTVQNWRKRNSIHNKHWDDIIEAGKKIGINVTTDILYKLNKKTHSKKLTNI